MRDIEFVSYDGEYPNLCRGRLVLKIDGIEHWFDDALISCGNPYDTSEGDWEVDFGKAWSDLWDHQFYHNYFSPEEVKMIKDIVNDKVEHGCCGGCI